MKGTFILLYSILVSVLLLPVGCDNFEYSPNQAYDRNTPRDLNAKSLERLLQAPVDDTVVIAFVGDSQRFYDHLGRFVRKVNSIPSVDFVLLAGDISDFGLLTEFEWVHKQFEKLKAPYFAVVGNHDVIANGENVFRRMYGPLDYSFVYDSIKFVVHNTNGREYPSTQIPNLEWLEQELQGENNEVVKYFVGVSHVPPTNDDFQKHLVEPYSRLLQSTSGFLVSLHGHIHNHTDEYPFNDGVRCITSYSFDEPSFLLLKISNGNIIKETINY